MSCARTVVERQSKAIAAANFFISTLVLLGSFPLSAARGCVCRSHLRFPAVALFVWKSPYSAGQKTAARVPQTIGSPLTGSFPQKQIDFSSRIVYSRQPQHLRNWK